MDLKFYETRYDVVKHFAREIYNVYKGDDLLKRLMMESCKGKLHTLMALLVAERIFINTCAGVFRHAYDEDEGDVKDNLILAGINVEDDLKKFAGDLVKTTIDHVISTIPDSRYFYEHQVNAFFDDLYDNMRALKTFYSNYKSPFDN